MTNLERRLKLHDILVEILGSSNVYFQPPESFQMKYPCIVYQVSKNDNLYADDLPYIHRVRYSVTIIDSDPDSCIRDAIEELRFCSFDRFFTSGNLNHFNYVLYY